MHVDDFADLIGIEIDSEEEGVDTVLGLVAKRLGRVPIPGASTQVDSWRLTAEQGAGRRNRIGTVLAEPLRPEADDDDSEARMTDDLDAEDAKLVTLARGARGRIGAATGAALRDETGRTYSGVDVSLPSLGLSALDLVVAQAVASGARGAEAAVLVGADPTDHDVSVLRDLAGTGVPVLACAPDGTVRQVIRT